MKPTSIHIIDPDKSQAEYLQAVLLSQGFEVETLPGPHEALSRLEQTGPDLIILDEKVNGLTPQEFLDQLQDRDSDAFLIVTSRETNPADGMSWIINGAFAFLPKPIDPARLFAVIEKGLENKEAYHQVVTMARDLKKANSDLENEKRALNEKTEQLRFLFSLSSELSSTLESKRIMETVVSAATQLARPELVCIYTHLNLEEPARLHPDRPLNPQTALEIAHEMGAKHADDPSRSYQPAKIERPLFPAREPASNTCHAMTFPLVAAGRTWGLLGLYFDEKPRIEPDRLMLLENVALQSAQALFNAHQHEDALNMAVHDPLTGLMNRRGFDQIMRAEFEKVRRYGYNLSLITIDLDHFKSVNDRYGHEAGDEVLRLTARLIKNCVRAADVPARIGGEEFAVLLPNTRKKKALLLARRIQNALGNTPIALPGGINLIQTVSQGVADTAHGLMQRPEDLTRLSDQAMYRAKKNGRNTIEASPEKVSYPSEEEKAYAWT
ncbi:MAG: diguanylate cyclase [Pseudomonadota bacterium]